MLAYRSCGGQAGVALGLSAHLEGLKYPSGTLGKALGRGQEWEILSVKFKGILELSSAIKSTVLGSPSLG